MDNSNARRPSEDGDVDGRQPLNKRKKFCVTRIQPATMSDIKEHVSLLNLPDELILHVLRFLSNDCLVNLARVHPTLCRISKDSRLWKRVRFQMFDKAMEDTYLSFLQNSTTHLDIKGCEVPNNNTPVSFDFLLQLKQVCQNLTHLSISNHLFNTKNINDMFYPQKLKSLKFEHIVVDRCINSSNYNFEFNIPSLILFWRLLSIESCSNLEDVTLNFNDWVIPMCLYSLSKLKKLTYLSLQGCSHLKNLRQFIVGTKNIGFKCLMTFDLRLTPINDSELLFIQEFKNLKHILLESPSYIDHDNEITTITDRGLVGFCRDNYKVQNREARNAPLEYRYCNIENLYVRNYPRVTDHFLKLAANACPSLKFLDVTGTSCTMEGVEKFKAVRPNVKINY